MDNRLKDLMDLLGLTQKEMALVLGIDQGSVSLYSSNRRKLPSRHVDTLVSKYNVNRFWLIGESNARPFSNLSENEEMIELFSELDVESKKALLDLAKFLQQQNKLKNAKSLLEKDSEE